MSVHDERRSYVQEIVIGQSNLFDENWYVDKYPDVKANWPRSAISHYTFAPISEGREPNPTFNTAQHIAKHRDFDFSKINPLAHYCLMDKELVERMSRNLPKHLFEEAQSMFLESCNSFDSNWYLNEYGDVQSNWPDSAVLHYVKYGALENRDPSESFSTKGYKDAHTFDDLNPLVHAIIHNNPFPPREKFRNELIFRKRPLSVDESWIKSNYKNQKLSKNVRMAARGLSETRFSIVVPVYNPPLQVFIDCVNSLMAQGDYDNYEIILVNDCSTDHDVNSYLKTLKDHSRIVVIERRENGHISRATNDGAAAATGEYLIFVDNDDLIIEDALNILNLYVHRHGADLYYSDELRIDEHGINPHGVKFKPGYSPEMLLSFCYFSHLVIIKKSLFDGLEGFRIGYEGSQDHDLWLRATEKTSNIVHIPQKLYVRRVLPGSTAMGGEEKPYAFEAGRKAVQDAFDRRGLPCVVRRPDFAEKTGRGIFMPIFGHSGPSVKIIIVSQLDPYVIGPLLRSLHMLSYERYSVTVLANNISQAEFANRRTACLNIYDTSGGGRTQAKSIEIIFDDSQRDFNFSYLNNRAASNCSDDLILFLNDDIEIINSRWLSQMVGWIQLAGVGIVGSRLIYPNKKSVQHDGIAHGLNGNVVGTLFRHSRVGDFGHQYLAGVTRNVGAVTGASLLVWTSAFNAVAGFDEDRFPVTYSDVDLCYRIADKLNKRIVICNDVTAIHHESASRSTRLDPDAVINYKSAYGNRIDNYVNPCVNLSRNDLVGSNTLIVEHRTPLSVLLISHNLNNEGAPNSLLQLGVYLSEARDCEVTVWSPIDGPLREAYGTSQVKFLIGVGGVEMENLIHDLNRSEEGPTIAESVFGHICQSGNFDCLISNTVLNYWAVIQGKKRGMGALWIIRESEGVERRFALAPPVVANLARTAFDAAYKVVYVDKATAKVYQDVVQHSNHTVIPNGLFLEMLDREQSVRESCRARLGIDTKDVVIGQVGTICERKSQLSLVKVFSAIIRRFSIRNIRLLLVGYRETDSYSRSLKDYVDSQPYEIRRCISLIDETSHVAEYYQAMDIFCFTSKMESYPRVLLEAMAYGLPIVSTKIMGTERQVYNDVNGYLYDVGSSDTMLDLLMRLYCNPELRRAMSANSGKVLKCLHQFEDMGRQYHKLTQEAALAG